MLCAKVVSMIEQKRRGLSAEQKAELWKRWKEGQSLNEIGRALGKDHVVVHFVLARHGGSEVGRHGGPPHDSPSRANESDVGRWRAAAGDATRESAAATSRAAVYPQPGR